MSKLVIGGTGFIGSHLCKRLLDQGHKVICMDNNVTGSLRNVRELRVNKNFFFIRHDIVFPLPDLTPYIDEIYHLACPASPKAYQADSIKTLKSNFIGTMNVLEFAKSIGARVLLTSTSEVYGDPKVSPQPETYWGNVNCYGPRSCYDEGKRVAETLMLEYERTRGVSIRIARIFNTYGPHMAKNDGRVVSNFINQCLEGKEITIYGDGKQTRSFCYVSDTVEGLILLMKSDKNDGPTNIGNPYEITIKNLSFYVKELTKSKSKIVYEGLPQDDPKRRKPDIRKANKNLNWHPKVPLLNGLDKTIMYFDSLE